ncbi:hypothetical protein CLAFUW4_09105 [Fulvia fulva]|uniref:Uncharacterized protein n=1 Tax=Passalora fulva TaxID=5499 RepID=A0A9Q8PGM7_PASFU|nr:uncharacterized protein CLAFUR5_09216 [Fulvia fulva]KAK4613434.1 hypothetical protein CLAFUR4_09111 [Fulvia fulva]KAK4614841.1 hypothetical protein CLAFUR0_09103 [Fulvia fulva]UJO22057.1 hypothetical protein CLAFUR5_09216 [Fulvia fulva]WPV20344.1 hypothetical protein CLAFUW4_09105 [Fulvia fulva]WPV35297.1 hypothetical protein CLAFUW7_09106 [Fulvia fulva]
MKKFQIATTVSTFKLNHRIIASAVYLSQFRNTETDLNDSGLNDIPSYYTGMAPTNYVITMITMSPNVVDKIKDGYRASLS